MLHEPCRTVGRQSTLPHAVQHGGVSCMGITNPPLALSGHARQFRAETLCSAKRGKSKWVKWALPHGGWDRVLDFVLTHNLIALTKGCSWCITQAGMGVKGNNGKRGRGVGVRHLLRLPSCSPCLPASNPRPWFP